MMETKEYIKANEKLYPNKRDIKYLFCKGKNSDKLIVTFPAFSSNGKPEYSYVRTLMGSNAYKLFLLDDFGSRGSYLIAENRDLSIESSVVSLILDICKKYNIKRENVILQGSSKGGYSALYFGIKYRFGYVISGAPQTKLGDYVVNVIPEVADYISGGRTESDKRYLNNLLFDLLHFPPISFPKIFIHVGIGDHHYKGHILPFIAELDKKCINYQIDLQKYHSHPAIAFYYPDFLINTLKQIDNDIISVKPLINSTNIKLENDSLELTCNAEGNELEYACYIFKENDCVEKIMYQKQNNFKYLIKLDGIYRAKLFVKDVDNDINSKITDEIEV